VKQVFGEIRLTTLGFFKSNCWYKPEPAANPNIDETAWLKEEQAKID
jgi:hypothetical protein